MKNDKGFTIEKKSHEHEKLSIGDMTRAAQEIFQPKNATVVIIGNSKGITKKKIREIIKNGLLSTE